MSKYICPYCGYIGKQQAVRPGNIFSEILLWICFVIPGLLYSIWRQALKHECCPQCHTRKMIAEETLHGQKLLKKYGYSK